MKINAYIFTINKNNSFKLDPDELKDLGQEISIYLSQKSYNDLLVKKTILSYYQKAVKRKIKQQDLVTSGAYLENFDEEGCAEVEQKRKQELDRLNLNDVQHKIVELLISGFSYKEIRKKLRINNAQLTNHIYRIKLQNTKK